MTQSDSVTGRVAKLEELLARVKARAGETRAPSLEAAPAPAPVIPDAAVTRSSFPPPATRAYGGLEIVDDDADASDASDAEVEVGAELIEVDIDVDADDEPTLNSGNAAASALENDGDDDEPRRTPGANEVVDLAPSSSPRAISDADENAFPAPRHTPPPESGKQVASAAPPALGRPSSVPPSSAGGHTLIGGWQKPGVPTFGLPQGEPRPQPFRPEASTQTSASQIAPQVRGGPPPVRIVPEMTKPQPLATEAKVATFEGELPAARPATFGELVDASLAL